MTQELFALKQSILEGRYGDALKLIDELEGMGRQAILRNIQAYLLRLLIHLIKNQAERRLTNSWAALIRDSLRQIQKLNLQDNKSSYYVKRDEWQALLEDEWEEAVESASLEGFQDSLSPVHLLEIMIVNKCYTLPEICCN